MVRKSLLLLCLLNLYSSTCFAQELSPRAYWPTPNGTMVAVTGYQYSFGDILTDPSLPFTGVDSKIHIAYLGYLQAFSLFNRTSSILIELPYTWGTTKGIIVDPLGELPGQANVSGIGDIGIALSINLVGAPSMNVAEFQELRNNPRQILGAALKILIPTGEYNADKLINVGANRWAFNFKLGYIFPIHAKWLLEGELGIWAFGDNDEFLGVTREQKPIYAAQFHLIRRFSPGFWCALNFNFFTGGRSTIGGEVRADLQRNSRIGVTLAYPFAGRHAIKGGFSIGTVTESGDDFARMLLGYQVLLN